MIQAVVKNIGDGFNIYTGKGFVPCKLAGEIVTFDEKFVYVKRDESGWVIPVDEQGYEHVGVLLSDILK